jgi:hypothetical protein
MPLTPAPRSKSELLARARQEARMSLGRAAFVRDARVLPIGVPIALGVAALVYARAVQERRDWRHAWRPDRGRPRRALGAAALTLAGAVAVAYVGARVEWDVRRRAWRALHDY